MNIAIEPLRPEGRGFTAEEIKKTNKQTLNFYSFTGEDDFFQSFFFSYSIHNQTNSYEHCL